jgi:uncharacterized membrane protein
MMKGVSAHRLMMFTITFIMGVMMLPVISDVINSVSGYLTTTEYTVASLFGVFLLIGIFKALLSPGRDSQYGYEENY